MRCNKDEIQNRIINLQDEFKKRLYEELRIYGNIKNISFDIHYDFVNTYTHCKNVKINSVWKNIKEE